MLTDDEYSALWGALLAWRHDCPLIKAARRALDKSERTLGEQIVRHYAIIDGVLK